MKNFKPKPLLALALLLSACGGDAKEMLGMSTAAPDEFAVERRPRLDVPPNFKLRPPKPGEAPLNSSETRDTAKEQITGTSVTSGSTAGEASLLSKVGATKANPDIRQILTKEAPNDDRSMLQKVSDAAGRRSEKTLVDPAKEKERIDENKKDNKPVTEGETPTKSENDGKSFFEKIFD